MRHARRIIGRLGRVDAAALVAARVEGVDQCVFGEAKVRRPVKSEAARYFLELGIHRAVAAIVVARPWIGYEGQRVRPDRIRNGQEGGDVAHFLLVIGVAQAQRELQIVGDIIIGLTKQGKAVEFIGRDRAEIVPVRTIAEIVDRRCSGIRRIGDREHGRAASQDGRSIVGLYEGRARVEEHVVAFLQSWALIDFIVDLDRADIEVERSVKVRLQPQFVGRLFAVAARNVGLLQEVGLPQLRVAHDTAGKQSWKSRIDQRSRFTVQSREGSGGRVEKPYWRAFIIIFLRGVLTLVTAAEIGHGERIGQIELTPPHEEGLLGFEGRVEGTGNGPEVGLIGCRVKAGQVAICANATGQAGQRAKDTCAKGRGGIDAAK